MVTRAQSNLPGLHDGILAISNNIPVTDPSPTLSNNQQVNKFAKSDGMSNFSNTTGMDNNQVSKQSNYYNPQGPSHNKSFSTQHQVDPNFFSNMQAQQKST